MSKLSFVILMFLVLFTFNRFVIAQEKPNADVYDATTKGLQKGKATDMPKPKFPPTAKALGISGQVNVLVTIDETGRVIKAVAKTGHPLLIPAAVEAAKLAKFTPTTLNGETVTVTGTIAYNFIRNPNWEKVGFSLGSIERQIPAFGDDNIESDFISKEFSELKEQLIKILQEQDIREKGYLAAKVINSIYQKLSIQEPTSAWHFRLGVIRSKFSTATGEESSFTDNFPKVKELFDSAPSDIPLERLADLAKVLAISNKPDLTKKDKQEIISLLTEGYNRVVNLPSK